MKDKITKSDVKFIADKFGWSLRKANSAINEFLNTPSCTNKEGILRICIDYDNPEDRKNNLYKTLYNINYDDLLEFLCNQIVNPDPCFDIVIAFNTTELKKSKEIFSIGYNEVIEEGSFLFRYGYGRLLIPTHAELYALYSYEPFSEVYSLCYEYLNTLLLIQFRQGLNRETLLLEIASLVGFMAFEIACLKDEAVSYSSMPSLNNMANRLARAIASPLNKKEITQRGYWLNYVIIERIRGIYGLRGAFRKLAEITSQKVNSIQPRYFSRKKIAKQKKLTLEDIILQYSLQKELYDFEKDLNKSRFDNNEDY